MNGRMKCVLPLYNELCKSLPCFGTIHSVCFKEMFQVLNKLSILSSYFSNDIPDSA